MVRFNHKDNKAVLQMYPMLKEGITIGTFSYEGSDEIHYFVENGEGGEFEISYELYKALVHADGTKPLRLRHCGGKKTVEELKRLGIIRTSRFVSDDEFFNRFIFFPIGSRARKYRPLCVLTNQLLPFLSIIMFVVGIILKLTTEENLYYEFNTIENYALIFISLAAHEMGHLVAGISAKYNFSDAGILLLRLFPIGAYVAHEEKKNATKAEKLNLALSGILVNLLIAGILFAGSVLSSTTDYTFIAAAQINCILAAVNLLSAEGLDGEAALSALLGFESISETAKKWIMNAKHRRKLFHSGFTGYASFCLFGFIMLSKALFWVLIVGDAIFAIIGTL